MQGPSSARIGEVRRSLWPGDVGRPDRRLSRRRMIAPALGKRLSGPTVQKRDARVRELISRKKCQPDLWAGNPRGEADALWRVRGE